MSIRLLLTALCAVLAAGCSPRTDAIDESGAEVIPAETRPQPLTADHVLNLIAADGAAHTLAVLTGPADPSGYDKVTAGVATGDAQWLIVAQHFRPHADGMYGEGLSDALYKALSKNAPGVLSVLKATGGASELTCESGPDNAAAIAAVTAVTDPALAETRQECLGFMSSPIEG
ncbi:hypothetical protein [Brevundimonas sp. NIBR11]|uniref:hypothetical protein n=1 Tax=Brevundimonas sp. NIBR11 TaxID=3015999 RepID=UPI0022F13379|nr:hypothetical protein [Brevundimonas sp. NIBR11]WGM31252.1 hypothetical protein KKHFBJBL_01496 [Brevundimonas sp. NIBR11]